MCRLSAAIGSTCPSACLQHYTAGMPSLSQTCTDLRMYTAAVAAGHVGLLPCVHALLQPDCQECRHRVKINVGTKSFRIALTRVAANVGSMSMGCYALGLDFIVNRMGLPESVYPRNFQDDLKAKVNFTSNKADVQQCGRVGHRYALWHHTVPVMHGHVLTTPATFVCQLIQVMQFLAVEDVRMLLTASGLKTLEEAGSTKGEVCHCFRVHVHVCVCWQ